MGNITFKFTILCVYMCTHIVLVTLLRNNAYYCPEGLKPVGNNKNKIKPIHVLISFTFSSLEPKGKGSR